MEYNLDAKRLRSWLESHLRGIGLNEISLTHVTSSIVTTSLRGTDSHGVNLFPHYYRAIQSGRINKNPAIIFNRTAGGTGILDADHAIGHHAGAAAMENAINLARESGIGAVGVKNSTHFGAAAYFALMAARKNMIGFSFTNADALVKAFGAKEAFFGTNPICFAAPLAVEDPFCLDMSTSTISWNKIINYRRENKSLPEGWAFDVNGQMTTDPHLAKSLNPIGAYKGYGLGMMVDILCSLLIGADYGKNLLPMYTSPIETRRRISHFFMAINIEKFIPVEVFKNSLQGMVDRLRKLEPLDSKSPVMVPNDPETKTHALRMEKGIPMDKEKFQEFAKISDSILDCIIK